MYKTRKAQLVEMSFLTSQMKPVYGGAVRIESYIIFKLKAMVKLGMELERQLVLKLSIHLKEEKCPYRLLNQSNSSVLINVWSRKWKWISRFRKIRVRIHTNTVEYNKTGTVIKLVISSKISIPKAATVCLHLSQYGINAQTPSQSGICRPIMKEDV